MKISIDTKNLTKEQCIALFSLIGEDYTLNLSGKEKSERLEARLRKVLSETKPNTTDYDFCQGPNYFFENDKVELKQFYVSGTQPKLQQVKPHLYDKILVAAEYDDKTEWWVIKTNKISAKAGKEHKEDGKLTLTRHHKGNELEGQISFKNLFKKSATFITVTSFVDYRDTNLGLSDEVLMSILETTKNH